MTGHFGTWIAPESMVAIRAVDRPAGRRGGQEGRLQGPGDGAAVPGAPRPARRSRSASTTSKGQPVPDPAGPHRLLGRRTSRVTGDGSALPRAATGGTWPRAPSSSCATSPRSTRAIACSRASRSTVRAGHHPRPGRRERRRQVHPDEHPVRHAGHPRHRRLPGRRGARRRRRCASGSPAEAMAAGHRHGAPGVHADPGLPVAENIKLNREPTAPNLALARRSDRKLELVDRDALRQRRARGARPRRPGRRRVAAGRRACRSGTCSSSRSRARWTSSNVTLADLRRADRGARPRARPTSCST